VHPGVPSYIIPTMLREIILIGCERKILLVGWWLVLIWCERKILLLVASITELIFKSQEHEQITTQNCMNGIESNTIQHINCQNKFQPLVCRNNSTNCAFHQPLVKDPNMNMS